MTVPAVNRRKNMPACFLRHTISNENLYDALEFTLISSLTTKRNMKRFSLLPKSSSVQAFRPLQAKFYKTFKHFQNQRGTNSATIHVKNSGWSKSNFQDLRKKKKSNVDTA